MTAHSRQQQKERVQSVTLAQQRRQQRPHVGARHQELGRSSAHLRSAAGEGWRSACGCGEGGGQALRRDSERERGCWLCMDDCGRPLSAATHSGVTASLAASQRRGEEGGPRRPSARKLQPTAVQGAASVALRWRAVWCLCCVECSAHSVRALALPLLQTACCNASPCPAPRPCRVWAR